MLRSELIKILLEIEVKGIDDPEVQAQASGCCFHAHEIRKVEKGQSDEEKLIVIRVS